MKKIIDAAMQEFQEKGYEQASMKAVADAVGMTSAALYRHFENKQDMFAALVQPALDELESWKGKAHRLQLRPAKTKAIRCNVGF
ncbi:MAG: helix-turn-helix domain-containing protein [Oscillospiraceae bacterium]